MNPSRQLMQHGMTEQSVATPAPVAPRSGMTEAVYVPPPAPDLNVTPESTAARSMTGYYG